MLNPFEQIAAFWIAALRWSAEQSERWLNALDYLHDEESEIP